jgi:hypothetical protein
LRDELIFERSPTLIHLAAGDVLRRRVCEAELADGEVVVFIANGRPEGAALHGSRSVEIAGACRWVEHGTRLVVGELFEGLSVMRLGEEDAGVRVTREAGGQQAFTRRKRSGPNAPGNITRRSCEPLAERSSIKWRDREYTYAALMATWMASEVGAGALGRRG